MARFEVAIEDVDYFAKAVHSVVLNSNFIQKYPEESIKKSLILVTHMPIPSCKFLIKWSEPMIN